MGNLGRYYGRCAWYATIVPTVLRYMVYLGEKRRTRSPLGTRPGMERRGGLAQFKKRKDKQMTRDHAKEPNGGC